uniref:Uncharacterized protein n=1 Tax=Arundo donax TaxID=35708 RepID=A0A0A8YFR9_ARUDO
MRDLLLIDKARQVVAPKTFCYASPTDLVMRLIYSFL